MATYSAYCVKCKKKQTYEGEVQQFPSGRLVAEGFCPTCDTMIQRVIGKSDVPE